jgi:hypothetical protein
VAATWCADHSRPLKPRNSLGGIRIISSSPFHSERKGCQGLGLVPAQAGACCEADARVGSRQTNHLIGAVPRMLGGGYADETENCKQRCLPDYIHAKAFVFLSVPGSSVGLEHRAYVFPFISRGSGVRLSSGEIFLSHLYSFLPFSCSFCT